MKKKIVTFLYTLLVIMLTACGSKTEDIDIDIPVVVVTKGFADNELFRIENIGCTIEEYMVYLTNIQNEYEEIYGEEIWDRSFEGVKLEDEVKEIALARISQIKAMKQMADSRGLVLGEDELQLAIDLGQKYFETLSTKEVETLNVTVDMISSMCQEYLLAEKLYETIIIDVDLEISDDEAREVTVEQIMIPTATVDENGAYHSLSEDEKNAAKGKIEEARKMLKGDESFDYVASIYSEAKDITYAYDRSSVDEQLESVIFDLAKGEISDVIETDKGYYIFYCVDTNNEAKTEENKIKILNERRSETFTREYRSFVEKLIVNLNKKLWNQVEMIDDDSISTNQFFTIMGEQSFDLADMQAVNGEE